MKEMLAASPTSIHMTCFFFLNIFIKGIHMTGWVFRDSNHRGVVDFFSHWLENFSVSVDVSHVVPARYIRAIYYIFRQLGLKHYLLSFNTFSFHFFSSNLNRPKTQWTTLMHRTGTTSALKFVSTSRGALGALKRRGWYYIGLM